MVASLGPPQQQFGALEPEDEWVKNFDADAFKKDMGALGDRMLEQQGPDDVAHLHKIIRWTNILNAIGLATMWAAPNPITICALGIAVSSRWTMIAHHTNHGGYNKQDDGSGRFTSAGFAVGSLRARVRDWLDWMLPEAWNVEHNNLHHYRLGEPGDPDLVERNMIDLREMSLPMPIKYFVVAVMACTWKWFYYAPNTYKQLKIQEMSKEEKAELSVEEQHQTFALPTFLQGTAKKFNFSFLEYFRRVMGPYMAIRFLLIPSPLLLISGGFFRNAVINLMLADVASNLHSFLVIATNHCGNDLYKFKNSVIPKSGSFYMRAVTSSVNFRTGGDINDYFHGWLNYQAEHHAWPMLSMLSYQKIQPQAKAICEKHGVPYFQQNVFKRLKSTADIMVGATSQREFKEEWETPKDRFAWR